MLMGRTPSDRYDELMARATRAHRKSAPRADNPGLRARREVEETEREQRKFFSWLAAFMGRRAA
jgi:hypothetical protein